MSNNPVNLALRFVLELAALAALGYWGWVAHDGTARWLWAGGLVVGAAAVWGVFRVPGDGGPPVVAVPGWVRLLIEAVVFGGATAALLASGRVYLGVAFGVIVVAHYAISYDRVVRFLRPSSAGTR